MIDIHEIARRLSVTVSVVRQLDEYAALKALRVEAGRKWTWKEDDADEWLRGFLRRNHSSEASVLSNATPHKQRGVLCEARTAEDFNARLCRCGHTYRDHAHIGRNQCFVEGCQCRCFKRSKGTPSQTAREANIEQSEAKAA
jgi:hypothetical protein